MTALEKVMLDTGKSKKEILEGENCPEDYFPQLDRYCGRFKKFGCKECWKQKIEEESDGYK